MTKERYLEMCKQLKVAPDPEKIPPGIEDFPDIVQYALEVFNTLGDRISADVGYLGKDYSILPVYLDNVTDKDTFLAVLAWLDSKTIQESAEEMKRARDKIKKK